MKAARLAVGGVALAAAGGAYLMFNRAPPPASPQIVQAAPNIETDDVLVAARELTLGTVLTTDDLAFQAWPRASVTPLLIRKSDGAKVLEDIKGSVVRSTFLPGEPLRRDKLVKGPNAGFLSAILPSGHRAVAISVDARGLAGGFILPNDRVDVIETARAVSDSTRQYAGENYKSRAILSNIKVLAIGPNIQEKNGEKVIVGETATLELTPREAEMAILAGRTGQLSLALRSMMDANEKIAETKPADTSDDKAFTVIRFGVAADQSVPK